MNNKPKFEKVNDNTIKIIVEKATDVPLSTIVENKKKLLAQKAQIEDTLKNVEEILAKAKELGITATIVDSKAVNLTETPAK